MDEHKKKAEPRTIADGVPVFCAYDKIVGVETLVPNPANPNTHPDEQIQALGRAIRYQGWRNPITVSNRSGFIVKGHGRLSAALLEGFKEVPVEYQNYATEADEYADLVADNRLAELSEIDQKKLADIFAEIDTGEIPLEVTGYTEKEIETLVTALSEALHEEKQEEQPEEKAEDSKDTENVATYGGERWDVVWKIAGTTDEGDTLLLLDEKTGNTAVIRLFKDGKQLSREQFKTLFES